MSRRTLALLLLFAIGIASWWPRRHGPIDLRWDGGVYYILGTALADGKGYRLLNEPGQIVAVQYPPVFPALIAAHQLILGSRDVIDVGRWLRFSSFLMFLLLIYLTFVFLEGFLSPGYAFLGTALSILTLHVYFLSDLLFPELAFSLCIVLFLSALHRESRGGSGPTFLWATLAYGLRTVGLTAFIAWIGDALLRRRFKDAARRTALTLIPVLSWQVFVASVESSEPYRQPAYAYQRAPYMFYNVSYARNLSLRDPFAPEKGPSSLERVVRRAVRNALRIPASLGETMTTARGYFEMGLYALAGPPAVTRLLSWLVSGLLFAIGCLVLVGIALLWARQQGGVLLFGLLYLAALCVTPFPAQYLRYLMPVVPMLALALITALLAVTRWPRARDMAPGATAVLVTMLAVKVGCAAEVYARELPPVSFLDRNARPVEQRLFFYDTAQREFDNVIEFLRHRAAPQEVIAAGTPHWIYLRTGLTSVMPPLEPDAARAQDLLDSVPVTYLIVGRDVVGTEVYMNPVIRRFPERWVPVFTSAGGSWTIYRRSGGE